MTRLPCLTVVFGIALASLPEGAAQPAPTAPATLLLGASDPVVDSDKADGGILIREIARQGILIAACEELGLATRDMALRESFDAPDGQVLRLDVRTHAVVGKALTLQIARPGGVDGKPVWETSIPLEKDGIDYLLLVSASEALSRGGFVEALRGAGGAGRPPPRTEGSPLPEGIERRLGTMTFSEPFAALREIHAAIRASGETPERLGGLVRGYANLGELTRFHWNGSSKALSARALLYAERMAASRLGDPWALQHRAYARALGGMHGAALQDLAAAAAAPGVRPAPRWVPWIDAFCRYDTPPLAASEDGLARFLAVLTAEGAGSTLFARDAIQNALQSNPDCYRLHDALSAIRAVGNLHQATVQGPEALRRYLYPRLRALPGLPAPAAEAAHATGDAASEPEVRVRVIQALLQAGAPGTDTGEPSWALLGRLIEETGFAQVQHRIEFMHTVWSVPVDDALRASAPLLFGHPYRALVYSYAIDPKRDPEAFFTLFRGVSAVDIGDVMRPLVDRTWQVAWKDEVLGHTAGLRIRQHRDEIASDREAVLRLARNEQDYRRAAHALLTISPHSPHALNALIEVDWAFAEPKAAAWEKAYAHHPSVIRALAKQYAKLDRFEDAERCFKKDMEIAPGDWSYKQLAALYKKRGMTDRWQQMLEAYLEQEDIGLEHAAVRVQLARHFMERGEWAKAEPYVEKAAHTWAEWAMRCASECYEGAGKWDKAEEWIRNVSERYDDDRPDWYLWCKRTGRGDAAAAFKPAEEYIREHTESASAYPLGFAGVLRLLNGQTMEALDLFQDAYARGHDPYAGLHAALAADALAKTDLRDALLQEAAEKTPKPPKKEDEAPYAAFTELAKKIRGDFATGGDSLDLGAVDAWIAAQSDLLQMSLYSFLGRYLAQRGRTGPARERLQKSAASSHHRWNHIIACDVLRSLPANPPAPQPAR